MLHYTWHFVRQQFRTKLGRCTLCMRWARNGSVVTAAATVASLILSAPGWFSGFIAAVALLFLALLLAHCIVFTNREYARTKRVRALRSRLAPQGAEVLPRRALLSTTAAMASGALSFSRAVAANAACPPDCRCYYSSDCRNTSRGDTCDRTNGSCTERPKPNERINGVLICNEKPGEPKCDGLCKSQRRPGASWSNVDLNLVANAADLYLRAYQTAAAGAGGPPDPGLLVQALAVAISNDWHLELQDAVHNLLDVLIGWDFLRGRDQYVEFGEVPALESAPLQLLSSIRMAFVAGLRNNQPEAATPALLSFWAQGEVYRPMHLGRCYPHGHPNMPDIPACQAEEISGLLTLLLRGR